MGKKWIQEEQIYPSSFYSLFPQKVKSIKINTFKGLRDVGFIFVLFINCF